MTATAAQRASIRSAYKGRSSIRDCAVLLVSLVVASPPATQAQTTGNIFFYTFAQQRDRQSQSSSRFSSQSLGVYYPGNGMAPYFPYESGKNWVYPLRVRTSSTTSDSYFLAFEKGSIFNYSGIAFVTPPSGSLGICSNPYAGVTQSYSIPSSGFVDVQLDVNVAQFIGHIADLDLVRDDFGCTNPLQKQLLLDLQIDDTPPSGGVVQIDGKTGSRGSTVTTSNTSFTITWSGTDGESGVAQYHYYSNTNGGTYGNYTPTTATSRSFLGTVGNTYCFIVEIEDNVGWRVRKSGPDLCVQIVAPPIISLSTNPAGAGSTSGGGTASYGQTVTVSANAAGGWQFARWTEAGVTVSSTASYSFSATSNRTLVANFDPIISASATPTNGGTVTGGGTCTLGSTRTLSASANSGFVFTGWTVNGAPAGAATSVSVQCLQPGLVVATFTPQCSITVGAGTGGSASIASGSASGACGRNVTVQATPLATYRFDRWSDGSTQNPYAVSVSQPSMSLNASFIPQCTLTATASPTSGGAVTFVTGSANGDCLRSVTLQATANPNYQFVSWSDGSTQAQRSVSVTQTAQTITATFQAVAPPCTITLGAASNGTATITSGTATGICGRNVTVQAAPNAGYAFAQWSDGAAANPYTFTLTTNVTLTPSFALVPCNVTLAQTTGGTVALTSGAATGTCGRNVTVQATPNTNFRFGQWSDGATQNPYTFAAATSTTLSATFVPQCTLTAAASPTAGGSISVVSGTLAGDCGRTVTLQASANPSYQFASWSDGNTQAQRSVSVTQTSQSISASFQPIPPNCTVTLGTPSNGTATITSGTASGACGRNVTVQAAPNAGFVFAQWSDGATANPYTFTLTSDITLTPTFSSVAVCTLSLGSSTGGTTALISGQLSGACGRNATVQATPNANYRFDLWSDGATANPYTLPLNAPTTTLSATFVPQCALTTGANPAAGGAVTVIAGALSGDCGRSVVLQAVAATGYQFAGWSDGNTQTQRSISVTQTSQSITASFQTSCTLTLGAQPNGTATIASGVATGACGRSVTVQATPSAGYAFVQWSDGATLNPYTLTLASDATLTPSFAQITQCAFVLGQSTGGTATLVSGTATGACNRSVTVQATPNAAYRFARWSDGGTANPYTLTVATGVNLTPVFIAQCTIAVGATPGIGGQVAVVSGGASGDCSRSVTVQANAAAGFTFQRWSDGATQNPYTFALSTNLALDATFVATPSCAITVSANAGGSATIVSGSATGACGRTVTIQATPAGGYQFVAWSDGNTSAQRSLAVTQAAQTISATFQVVAPNCTITLSTTPAAAGTSTGAGTAPCSQSRTVVAQANPGFTFVSWMEGSQSVSTSPTYTFTAAGDRSLVAVFQATCALTVGSGAGGSAAIVAGTTNGACGRSVTVSATPNAGFTFRMWSDGATSNPYAFVLSTNLTLSPTFQQTIVPQQLAPRAIDALLGKSTLTDDERKYLDQQGNRDGVFNLGDVLALLDASPSLRLDAATLGKLVELQHRAAATRDSTRRRVP